MDPKLLKEKLLSGCDECQAVVSGSIGRGFLVRRPRRGFTVNRKAMPTSLGHRHLDLMDQDCSTVMEAARHGRLRMTPARVLVLSLVGAAVQLGLAVVVFGGWTAFSSHPALITLVLVTLGMIICGRLQQCEPVGRSSRFHPRSHSLRLLSDGLRESGIKRSLPAGHIESPADARSHRWLERPGPKASVALVLAYP